MAESLGIFEQAVLLAIIRLRDDAYGRAIHKEVCGRLGRDVSTGAVQSTLDRLERKDLLTSHPGEGTEIRAGRRKRFYVVAADGRRALDDARAVAEKLWSGFAWPLKGSA